MSAMLLEPLLDAWPDRPVEPTELVLRAGSPGPLQDRAVAILAATLEAPDRANPLMRRMFRKDRAFGSKDRGLAKEVLVQVYRARRALERGLRAGGWDGARQPEALWLASLVHTQGLPAEVAAHSYGAACFAPLEDLAAALRAWAAAEAPSPAQQLACVASLPLWLAEDWVAQLGADGAAALMIAQNQRAPLSLRANRGLTDPEGLCAALAEDGITAEPARWTPDGVTALGPANLRVTQAFKQGLFEMQDEGSQLITELVQPPRRALVVDFCAGAGGKSLAIAASLPRGSRVVGFDVRQAALDQGRRRAHRARVSDRVRFERIGEEGPLPVEPGAAARVLVDAPCSGTGTLRRSPALRERLTLERIAALQQIQARILARAAPLVRSGGRLIYATCSLLRQENEDTFAAFLADNPDFSPVDVKEILGSARAAALSEGGALKLLPHVHGTDGFFAAVAQRR
ncbi:MAG: RsmB/NOP family class I SAM-dependent RNA methyltransferase [Alphaproteobacteria bacterium]|nr:RsmB/NOP family class I SAM-dependent RNA methyltransferase [Alphaproteobacteria bacterium]